MVKFNPGPNQACVRGAKEITRRTKEFYGQKCESEKRETYQAAKEAASFLCAKGRGRVGVCGGIGERKRITCCICGEVPTVAYHKDDNRNGRWYGECCVQLHGSSKQDVAEHLKKLRSGTHGN